MNTTSDHDSGITKEVSHLTCLRRRGVIQFFHFQIKVFFFSFFLMMILVIVLLLPLISPIHISIDYN